MYRIRILIVTEYLNDASDMTKNNKSSDKY